MRLAHPETVTIVRPVRDSDGDVSSQIETAVSEVGVFPRVTGLETNTPTQDVVTIDVTVVVPSGTDIKVTDSVIVRGVQYRVSDTPTVLLSPFTGKDEGISVPLITATG